MTTYTLSAQLLNPNNGQTVIIPSGNDELRLGSKKINKLLSSVGLREIDGRTLVPVTNDQMHDIFRSMFASDEYSTNKWLFNYVGQVHNFMHFCTNIVDANNGFTIMYYWKKLY